MRTIQYTLLVSLLGCLPAQAADQAINPTNPPVANVIEPIMVTIPSGEFLMGDDHNPHAQPAHKVSVASFQLSKYELTTAEFEQFQLATNYKRDGQCSLMNTKVPFDMPFWAPQPLDANNLNTRPAFCVSWADADAYVRWLNVQTGKHYYLPSEAQWEYAARAGSKTRYFFGDDERKLCDYANVYQTTRQRQSRDMDLAQPGVACDDYTIYPAAVGSFLPNAYDLYDMIGNADEWVADCAAESYAGAPGDGSARASKACKRHILRGGSWSDAENRVETSYRQLVDESSHRPLQSSFRLALSRAEKSHLDENFARNLQRSQEKAKAEKTNNIALIEQTIAASKTWKTGDVILPPMVTIPAGEFLMGGEESEKSKPIHKVNLKAFKMSPYEVTIKQFKQFVQSTGYLIAEDKCWQWVEENGGRAKRGIEVMPGNWLTPAHAPSDYHPVMCISWDDANAYLTWLSQTTGKHYRLPTEAEWEYAARAGNTSKYGVGHDEKALCDYGNIWDVSGMRAFVRDKKYQPKAMACDDGVEYTSVVGTYKPNAFGLYDMLGNISEWTQDCDQENYLGAPTDGSAWVSKNCSMRSRRGSHYGPGEMQISFRGHGGQSNRSGLGEGFRIVEELGTCASDTKTCKKALHKSDFAVELKRAQKAEQQRRKKAVNR